MGNITEEQRKWLEGIGVNTAVADGNSTGAPVKAPTGSPAAAGAASAGPTGANAPVAFSPFAKPDEYGSPAPADKPVKFLMTDADMQKFLQATAEREKKEAEEQLVKVQRSLADVKAYVEQLPVRDLQSYTTLMTDLRKRFPEAAGVSQWVKETSIKVPALKGKLPSPKALMETVKAVTGARLTDVLSAKDPAAMYSDQLLASYMSELPAGVGVVIDGGVVKLSMDGAAIDVKTPAGDVDAKVDKGGAKLALKNDNLSIQVENKGWKEFDPELRAKWNKIAEDAKIVIELQATRDKAKLEFEKQKKVPNGADVKGDLSIDLEKKEAEFNLAWKKLQEEVTVVAKVSEDKISASVAYLKKNGDKESVKAGADVEVDLKKMQAQLKAYFASPTVEAVLQVSASADKASAKLEVTAVKAGVVVTAEFEKALDETKVAIDALIKGSGTTIGVELQQKAKDLTAKLKVVQEAKDLKLAVELEKSLKEIRGSINAEYKKGAVTGKGGITASNTGEVGGEVQIDIALKNGRTFVSDGDKLSFTANVSNKGYKFGVNFSMGKPVDPGSLRELFKSADEQIKQLYRMAGDKGVRSIADINDLNQKMTDIMKPVKDAAEKAKAVQKKQEIQATFGISVQGEWPAGGRAAPPALVVGLTLTF